MATGMKAHNRHAGPPRRTRIWWLAGGMVAAATITVVLGVGLFGSNAPGGSTTARQTNRIFADERGYVPTVEEYQAVLLEPAGAVTVEAMVVAPEGAPGALRCQVAVTTGLALCTPQWEQPKESGPRLSGPR